MVDGSPMFVCNNQSAIRQGEQLLVDYGEQFLVGFGAAKVRTAVLEEILRENKLPLLALQQIQQEHCAAPKQCDQQSIVNTRQRTSHSEGSSHSAAADTAIAPSYGLLPKTTLEVVNFNLNTIDQLLDY